MIRTLTTLLLLTLLAPGCSGGHGDDCERAGDCRGGRRCELSQCVGQDSLACGYLRACLRRRRGMAPTILGTRLVQLLDSHPDEQACRARLRLLAATGQGDALLQACGPRVP